MRKKPPASIRPHDVMARFDRLLATMAPKVEPQHRPHPRPLKPRGPKPRKTRV